MGFKGMQIGEKLRTTYKNMKLTKKMLLVYFIFAGFFFVVTIAAFQMSMDAFEQKLYETSLQELDYYVKSVKDGLEAVEDRTYEMIMDSDIQEELTLLNETEPATVEYNQIMTNLRWRLINDNSLRSEVRTVRFVDNYGQYVESGTTSWEIPEETMEAFMERVEASDGQAVFYGPTEECRYLLCGRKIRRWTDMSLQKLGTIVLVCDVRRIIVNHKEQLETERNAIFVYTDEHMIYQDIEEELPSLPRAQDEQGYQILKYEGERYFMCWLTASDMGWTYVNFFPYSDIFGQITRVQAVALLCFSLVFILLLILIRQITGLITKPLETLTQSMQVVETGDFQSAKSIPMETDREDEVGLLTQEFHIMLDKIDILLHENYEKQILLKDTKYKMLRAQINPHFLYNTLNAIHWMIRAKKNDQAGRMIVELGTLLRESFNEDPYATVEEEINMINSYIGIQRYRYEDRAEFSVQTEGQPEPYVMPRMTLQPLVENAIFYGADVMAKICHIGVTITEEAEHVLFEVRDDGPGIRQEDMESVRNFTIKPKGHGIGLKNIYERLDALYDTFEFTIDSEEGKGTWIRIRVPKMRKEEREDVQTSDRG